MATKLKNMQLTSVDLVRAGANQEADICLFKSADPAEAAGSPTEGETNILKRFLSWLRENPTAAASEPQTAQEDEIEKADEPDDIVDLYKSAITESLQSIVADDSLSVDEKNAMIEKSIGQYHDAMVDLLLPEEDLEKSDPEELGYLFEDLEKSASEEEEVEKSDRYDEIEEVELVKGNPYHAADGKFTTATGGAGGAMSPGEKSTAIANAAISQSKKETKSTMGKLKSGKMGPEKALESLNTTALNLQETRSSLSFGAGKQRAALNTEISRVEGLIDMVYFGNY